MQRLLCALLCVLSASAFSSRAATKPNILVIVADDLGYADVLFSPQHPKEVSTPHLDALAKSGVICRQGYVSGHVCSPTRAGLMTGRYQQRLGLYTGGEAGSGLPMREKLFPQFLKPAGYATAQFGKWHLGPTMECSPAHRGFDEVFGFLGRGAHDYFKLDDPEDPIYRGTNVLKETGYLTDRLGEETAAFITRNKARPFFAYLAFNAVHAPLQAPADEIAKFNTGSANRNTLLAMGKRMDDAIGRIVTTLKQEGVWENTLLFFISDNGGPLAQTANNAPLRGGKHSDYEGGVRVPFLAQWPGRIPKGKTYAHPVIALDLLPTFVAAAGGAPGADWKLDGVNLLPYLEGKQKGAPHERLFWRFGRQWAMREGDWKLMSMGGAPELYNLRADIGEQKDLSFTEKDRLGRMSAAWEEWNKGNIPARWVPAQRGGKKGKKKKKRA